MVKIFATKGRARPRQSGFGFTGGGNFPNPTTWSEWLKNQAAPRFKPGHRLPKCGIYYYGHEQEEGVIVDMAERWGFVLNTGYEKYVSATIPDSQLANPTTKWGRLLKMAIADPTKYKIGGAVGQHYPSPATLPSGYVTDRTTNTVTGLWSPAAPVAAQTAAQTYRMDSIRKLNALGVQWGLLYDGGENEFGVPGDNPDVRWGQDSQVVADKGSRAWMEYLSLRKGEDIKRIYDEIKTIAPNVPFVYYPCEARAYLNVPGSASSTWEYSYLRLGVKYPSSSSYFYEFNLSLGDPSVRDRAYYDLLTNCTSAVVEQIATFGDLLSCNFVSGGWFNDVATNSLPSWAQKSRVPERFASIEAYEGFLKCYYTIGNIAAIAGYFSPDCVPGLTPYPPYSSDPAKVPPFLEQQITLGKVHAIFSWVDDFLFEGDLLPGIKMHPIKTTIPAYEFDGYKRASVFYVKDIGVRVFVRKLRNASKWLLTAWAYDGVERDVYINDIPSLPIFQVRARLKAYVYTIELVNGTPVVIQKD